MNVKDVITFGANYRIEEAQNNYKKRYEEYEAFVEKYNLKNKEVEAIFQDLIDVKIKVQVEVKKIQKLPYINANIIDRNDKQENIEKLNTDLEYIEKSLKVGDILIGSIKGSGTAVMAGAGAAPAALWLVTTFGTASTGTAISTLSGAAATNAALAVLGGGTIATGGGGMAAGTAFLATLGPIVGIGLGIIAVPTFMHLTANKKIKEIKEAEYKLCKEIKTIEENMLKLYLYEERSYELINSCINGIKAFSFIYKKTMREIFPLGIISVFFKKLKMIITKSKNFYKDDELEKIRLLIKSASDLLKIRDQPIIEIEETNNNQESL